MNFSFRFNKFLSLLPSNLISTQFPFLSKLVLFKQTEYLHFCTEYCKFYSNTSKIFRKLSADITIMHSTYSFFSLLILKPLVYFKISFPLSKGSTLKFSKKGIMSYWMISEEDFPI